MTTGASEMVPGGLSFRRLASHHQDRPIDPSGLRAATSARLSVIKTNGTVERVS